MLVGLLAGHLTPGACRSKSTLNAHVRSKGGVVCVCVLHNTYEHSIHHVLHEMNLVFHEKREPCLHTHHSFQSGYAAFGVTGLDGTLTITDKPVR
jgi:hypothetical protein